MAKPTQDTLPAVDAKEWREKTFRDAYIGILDKDALEQETARFRGLQELREKKLEAQCRQAEWHAFLEHPGWIAAPPAILCVYSHFTFGIAKLLIIILDQVIFLRFSMDLTHAPVTLGLLVTGWLFGCYTRRSLKDCIPALALLFDLCCLGIVATSVHRIL